MENDEYISVCSAAELVNANIDTIRTYASSGRFGEKIIRKGKNYVKKTAVLEYFQRQSLPKLSKLPKGTQKGYVDYEQAADIIGVAKNTPLREHIPGAIRVSQGRGNSVGIIFPLKEVLRLKEEYDRFIEEYFEVEEVKKVTGISKQTLYKLMGNGDFGKVYTNPIGQPKKYVKKIAVNEYIDNNMGIPEGYILSKNIAQILSICNATVSDYRKKGYFGETIERTIKGTRVCLNKLSFVLDYVERLQNEVSYIKENGLVSSNEISSILNSSRIHALHMMAEGHFGESFMPKYYRPESSPRALYFVRKDLVIYWLSKRKEQEPLFGLNSTDPFETLDYGFSNIVAPPHITKSIEMAQNFFSDFVENSNADDLGRYVSARNFVNNVKYLNSTLHKEIFDFSDKELELYLQNPDFSQSRRNDIVKFVNYVKRNLREKCSYANSYRQDVDASNRGNNGKELKTACYEVKDFFGFYKIARDIERHIEKAIKNRAYASSWLYVCMLLMNGIRHPDLISMNKTFIADLGLSLDYFRRGNRLSLEQAEIIFNRIREFGCVRFMANKNGGQFDFHCAVPFVGPMSTAYVICLLHEELAGDGLVIKFGLLLNRISPVVMGNFLGKENEFYLSIQKMNRSLETYFWKQVKDKHGGMYSALMLSRRLRGHKISVVRAPRGKQAIQYYIARKNDGVDLDLSALELFNRGEFGFLYHMILKGARSEKGEKLTLTEQTGLINEMKGRFELDELENLSRFLHTRLTDKLTVALEIVSNPSISLTKMIDNLNINKLPSMRRDVACVTYPICHMANGPKCIICSRGICTAAAFQSIADEFYSVIAQILKETNFWEMQLLRSKLAPLVDRINEAFRDFKKGKLKAYFNPQEIMELLQICEYRYATLKDYEQQQITSKGVGLLG